MEQATLTTAQADRLHELTCQLKFLQDALECLLEKSVDADVAFGVYLVFQIVIEGLEGVACSS